jgi:hypothetical protein
MVIWNMPKGYSNNKSNYTIWNKIQNKFSDKM